MITLIDSIVETIPSHAPLVSGVRVLDAKNRTFGMIDITAGITPRAVPAAFDEASLACARCAPLAQCFCLNDAALGRRVCLRHVDLPRAAEEEQLRRLRGVLSAADVEAYAQLIVKRYRQLVDARSFNREWNWYGNVSLPVIGNA